MRLSMVLLVRAFRVLMWMGVFVIIMMATLLIPMWVCVFLPFRMGMRWFLVTRATTAVLSRGRIFLFQIFNSFFDSPHLFQQL